MPCASIQKQSTNELLLVHPQQGYKQLKLYTPKSTLIQQIWNKDRRLCFQVNNSIANK